MRASAFTTVAIAGLLAAGAGVAQPAPRDAQFQVNSYTPDQQSNPAVAVNAQGQFLVVWDTPTVELPLFSTLRAQLYSAGGAPQGAEFAVDSITLGVQRYPAVASTPNGEFIVVWSGTASNGSDLVGIQGRRFSAAGAPLGLPFEINSYTSSNQAQPRIATYGDGDFVVVWASLGSSGSDNLGYSVQGRRFDSVGLPVSSEFQVNTVATGSQDRPDVAADAAGAIWIVFESSFPSGGDPDDSIQARSYDASGTPTSGTEFTLNQTTLGGQLLPVIAANGAGLFLAAWESAASSGTDSDGRSVQGYLLDALGEALGDEFQLNTYTTASQIRPAVAPYGEDSFVVSWQSYGSNGTDAGANIQARTFAEPADFQVNSFTPGAQTYPAIASDAVGNFVVVWESAGSPGNDIDGMSIQGRRFDALFADGFASGTLLRWSTALP